MITTSFDSINDGDTVVGKRLTIYYNGKVVSTTDLPAESDMNQDQLDSYVAGKLAGIFA